MFDKIKKFFKKNVIETPDQISEEFGYDAYQALGGVGMGDVKMRTPEEYEIFIANKKAKELLRKRTAKLNDL
jgi:hypothetical protein